MNSRQRFRDVMAYGNPDRVPFFEEGIRADVIKAWQRQGMPENTPLDALFPIDQRIELAPDLLPDRTLKQWPDTGADLPGYSRSLNVDDPARLPAELPGLAAAHADSEDALLLRVHRGLYQTLGVAAWDRFAEVNLLLNDQPQLVKEMLEIQAAFAAGLVERILSEVSIDAAIFSEPISGNSGPLVSPAMFEGFVDASYEPLLAVLRRHGVQTIILRTYANARTLLPLVVERGFNCLWACEVNLGAMDYEKIRGEFGRELRLVGGIDVDVLRQDEASIQRELAQKLPPLLADGGFIPLADGRVRAVVPYQNYVFYRNLLAEIVGN